MSDYTNKMLYNAVNAGIQTTWQMGERVLAPPAPRSPTPSLARGYHGKSWEDSVARTGLYSGMTYSISDMGGFLGTALYQKQYANEIQTRKEYEEEQRKAQEQARANGTMPADPLAGAEMGLSGIFESLWGGLKNLGNRFSNLLFGSGHFETDVEMQDRETKEAYEKWIKGNLSEGGRGVEGLIGAVTAGLPAEMRDEIIKKLAGADYQTKLNRLVGVAGIGADDIQLLAQNSSSPLYGQVKGLFEELRADAENLEFDPGIENVQALADYNDKLISLSDKIQALQSITNKDATIKGEIARLTAEKRTLKTEHDMIQRNMIERKGYFDEAVKFFSTMTSENINSRTQATVGLLCCVISNYLLAYLEGKTDASFAEMYKKEIIRGNVKGTDALVSYNSADYTRNVQGYGYLTPWSTGEAPNFAPLTFDEVQGYADRSKRDFFIVFADTRMTGSGRHWYITSYDRINKDFTQYDHSGTNRWNSSMDRGNYGIGKNTPTIYRIK